MESPLTIEESITLLNNTFCTLSIQDVVHLRSYSGIVSIESLGFAVRRGQTAPQMKFDKVFLKADEDSLQPVKSKTLYHSNSCPTWHHSRPWQK